MKLPRFFRELPHVGPRERSESSRRRRLVELIYVDVARRRVALEVVYDRVEVHRACFLVLPLFSTVGFDRLPAPRARGLI